jgi:diguanylate cyclase (GGDEF)-like protein
MEPVLLALGARVRIVLSVEAALAGLTAPEPPSLALLDVSLPGLQIDPLLTSVRAAVSSQRLPLVLVVDTVTPQWICLLDQGLVDDLLLRGDAAPSWRLRLEQVLRAHRQACELESLREAALLSAQVDHLTGVYNRESMLAMLFRETDRAQRMSSALSLVLFDIDDFGHWNARLGAPACDELLSQVAVRTAHLLRSYDLLGRTGKDEFLIGLPGCDAPLTLSLAQRLCRSIFGPPFRVAGQSIRLSACFGIAHSLGRSPLVVLREAEQALQAARQLGPESIQCFVDSQRPDAAPITLFSPTSGEDLLAW